jgi:hypothetical protein
MHQVTIIEVGEVGDRDVCTNYDSNLGMLTSPYPNMIMQTHDSEILPLRLDRKENISEI